MIMYLLDTGPKSLTRKNQHFLREAYYHKIIINEMQKIKLISICVSERLKTFSNFLFIILVFVHQLTTNLYEKLKSIILYIKNQVPFSST